MSKMKINCQIYTYCRENFEWGMQSSLSMGLLPFRGHQPPCLMLLAQSAIVNHLFPAVLFVIFHY